MFGWFAGDRNVANEAVTVFYIKSARLSESLREIAARYGERVTLRAVSRMPGSGLFFRPRQPTIRVMRGRAILSEAMGVDLPRRELDRVIRGALEHPV